MTTTAERREVEQEFDAAWKAVEDFAGDKLATRLVKAVRRLDRLDTADSLRAAKFEPILP